MRNQRLRDKGDERVDYVMGAVREEDVAKG